MTGDLLGACCKVRAWASPLAYFLRFDYFRILAGASLAVSFLFFLSTSVELAIAFAIPALLGAVLVLYPTWIAARGLLAYGPLAFELHEPGLRIQRRRATCDIPWVDLAEIRTPRRDMILSTAQGTVFIDFWPGAQQMIETIQEQFVLRASPCPSNQRRWVVLGSLPPPRIEGHTARLPHHPQQQLVASPTIPLKPAESSPVDPSPSQALQRLGCCPTIPLEPGVQ